MKKHIGILLLTLMLFFTACENEITSATTVKGYEDEIDMVVKIKGDSITSIEITKHNESPFIGASAIELLPQEIINEQSLMVDAITGATETSNAIKEGVRTCLKNSGVDIKKFEKEVKKTASEEIEKTADVVIIGGGGAGLSAAVAAAEEGSKVILIEKMPMLGGNTVRAGGAYNSVDPERQKNVDPASDEAMESLELLVRGELKEAHIRQNEDYYKLYDKWIKELEKDLNTYKQSDKSHLFDSKALHIIQTFSGGDYEGNIELIEKLISDSLPTLKWLESNGMVWKENIATVPGGLWPRAHIPKNAAGRDFIETNKNKANSLGVEFIMDCKGKDLIMQGGRVVAVSAEKRDGTKLTLNANKAVIIATGGFAGNKEMREKYDPNLVKELGTTNSPAIQGDGIVMAEKINANLVGMEYIQCLPWGNPKNGSLNGWLGGIGVEYYYQVNTDGKRFMTEDGRRDYMTGELLKQKGAMSYVITDTNRESENSETNLWGDNIEELVKSGTVYRADTIEDLAKQINIDPKILRETHDTFNSYVESGVDKDFDRKLFGDKIDKAPFYASPRMPTVHHTMGGIQIDEKARVIDRDGKIIPGLYAAGEVTGGIHGKNRLGGNALVDVHVFGYEAGKNAAAEKVK